MLILEGRSGLGKTTAVVHALRELGVDFSILGAYSTPLGLYKFLNENASKLVLIDDTSGVFASNQSMAILKAATWDLPGVGRLVRWTSQSEKIENEEFLYTGKIIVIVNGFPKTSDADAVKNRSLEVLIDPYLHDTIALLKEAATDTDQFPDQSLAQVVLRQLVASLTQENFRKVSYRTLQKVYEIAAHNPDYQISNLISCNSFPRSHESLAPHKVITRLNNSGAKLKDQLAEFERLTGFKRRSFFKYRKQLGLSNLKDEK